MLRKLMKYEIKATARTFLPLYIVLIAFALINRLIGAFSQRSFGAPDIISLSLYIIILIGLFVMTFIVMITRFYKNLLSDEGYLMFTLPLKTSNLIISKLLISMMWLVISLITALLSILIIASREVSVFEIIDQFRYAWQVVYSNLGPSLWLTVAEILISFVLGIISGILIIYASIALGHLLNKHKIPASFGAFLFLNTITQIVSAIITSIFLRTGLNSLFYIEVTPAHSSFHSIMWLGIILSSVFAITYFMITNFILTKRLNLE